MFLGCTMKYGIFVPSVDVASNCSVSWWLASNFADIVFSTAADAFEASDNQSVVGVRKPVTFSTTWSLCPFALHTIVDELSGSGTARCVHEPFAARPKTKTRPFTF